MVTGQLRNSPDALKKIYRFVKDQEKRKNSWKGKSPKYYQCLCEARRLLRIFLLISCFILLQFFPQIFYIINIYSLFSQNKMLYIFNSEKQDVKVYLQYYPSYVANCLKSLGRNKPKCLCYQVKALLLFFFSLCISIVFMVSLRNLYRVFNLK